MRDIVTLQFGFESVNELDWDSSLSFPSRLRDWTGTDRRKKQMKLRAMAYGANLGSSRKNPGEGS
jgi:hypothetical protein